MSEASSFGSIDSEFGELSVNNFEENLPKIITFISEEAGSPNFLQFLNVVLSQVAGDIDVDILDSKLLKHVLPPTRLTFEASLAEIKNLVEDTDSMEEDVAINISKLLQICLDILTGFGELIDVVSKRDLKAEYVSSINRHLPSVLLEAFSHCKNSEESYGLYFEESTSILTTFFKKCYEIQMKYYKVLDDKIVFTTAYEDDVEMLVSVLLHIWKMAEIVVSLDLKTAGDQWKLYGKLYSKHASNLQQVVDVSRPLELLSSNTKQIVSLLVEGQDGKSEKLKIKFLKIGNFLLKMIIKLCELSCCDFQDGWRDLLDLLLLLNSCTKTYELGEEFKEELRRCVCVAATPLLRQLLKASQFHKAFENLTNSLSALDRSSKVGLLFLSLAIMKAVVEKKAPAEWENRSFVEFVVDLYDDCGVIIDTGSAFDGNDAYSSLVSICAAFTIATVEGPAFGRLENHLMVKLFKHEFHTSLFVSDLFCLIGRLTSDEYCLHVTTYLCQALNSWPKLQASLPQHKIVVSLIRRLWALLTDKSRHTLLDLFKAKSSHKVCSYILCDDSSFSSSLESYREFSDAPSLSSYISLMSLPPSSVSTYEQDLSSTAVNVMGTITYIFDRLKSCRGEDLWLHRLLATSLRVISPALHCLPPDLIDEMFEVLSRRIRVSDDNVKLIVLLFLIKCAKSLSAIRMTPKLCQALVDSFVAGLESDSQVTQSMTLQLLSSQSASPTFNQVLTLISTNYGEMLRSLSAPSDGAQVHLVMSALSKPIHKCPPRSREPVVELNDQPPAKKAKVSERDNSELLACVHRLQLEVNLLKTSQLQAPLPDDMKTKLKVVADDLYAICQNSCDL